MAMSIGLSTRSHLLEKRDSADNIGGIVVDERQIGRARAGEGLIVVCSSCPSLDGIHQYSEGDRSARSHLFDNTDSLNLLRLWVASRRPDK